MKNLLLSKLTDTDLYSVYLQQSQELVEECRKEFMVSPKILKIDAWNEAKNKPNKGIVGNLNASCMIIEVDKDIYEEAKKNMPYADILMGDIRNIQLPDEYVHGLIDLSTLDHIPFSDVETALKEYKRVVKEQGKILLVTWFAEDEEFRQYCEKKKWTTENQYYFEYELFTEMLKNYFDIKYTECLYKVDRRSLVLFEGQKV